jgi:ubiquitin-protein ligase
MRSLTLSSRAAPEEANIFKWRALIYGPEESPYEGGKFNLTLYFTEKYPFVPPKVRLITPSSPPPLFIFQKN